MHHGFAVQRRFAFLPIVRLYEYMRRRGARERKVRMTLDLPDDLWQRCKAQAALEGVTLGDFVARQFEEEIVRVERRLGIRIEPETATQL
jgi:hypothetical protein